MIEPRSADGGDVREGRGALAPKEAVMLSIPPAQPKVTFDSTIPALVIADLSVTHPAVTTEALSLIHI